MSFESLKKKWGFLRRNIEVADTGFLVLRVVVLSALYAWVFFSRLPSEAQGALEGLLGYFALYSLLICGGLFLRFDRKAGIYAFSVLFDLSMVALLVHYSGGFASNFFVGFYFLAAMHSFYFGNRFGLVVATLSWTLYLFSCGPDFSTLAVADFVLRVGVLYLLALPIGLLSDQLRHDKQSIETLNCELLKSIHQSEALQHKMIREERFAALGKITADVAHEIRNPLTAIGGFARRLRKSIGEGGLEKEYAEIIVSESGRLERVLRDVLNFSRETRLDFRKAPLNDVAAAALRAVSPACIEESIQVCTEFDDTLPDLLIDGEQLRQAMQNVLLNAIDAMRGGGRLTVRTRREVNWGARFQVVQVIDTGPGIEPERLDRLFDPFFTTKEIGQIGQGTGLGLAICRKIMDEHKGGIRVSSTIGAGSRFSLALPWVPEEDAPRPRCWEVMKCGIEQLENSAGNRCPAYPDFGTMCWVIAGTFCERKVQGAVAEKLGDCSKCLFYRQMNAATAGEVGGDGSGCGLPESPERKLPVAIS